jgi:hypothetical protein
MPSRTYLTARDLRRSTMTSCLAKGLKTDKDSEKYTVREAVTDWLAQGTRNLDPGTVSGYRILAGKHLMPAIGATRLKALSAGDVGKWLNGFTGKLSTGSLVSVHSILRWAIRQAQARDKVGRNVAGLVTTPRGRDGRPSKALTPGQATAVMEQARSSWLHAYVVVTITTGIRTEEARALRWDHVAARVDDEASWQPVIGAGFDHDRFAIYVWRSVRADGDTKTGKSRRTAPLERTRPAWFTRTGPQASRRQAGPPRAGPRPTPKLLMRPSSSRQLRLTEPVSEPVGRCPSAGWPPCSARPPGGGPVTAWPKPGIQNPHP